MKVYLDNVIVSGIVRGDLQPPEEMAVRDLVKADEKGQIEIYTSRWTWAEQDRTDNSNRRKVQRARPLGGLAPFLLLARRCAAR